MPRRIVKRDDLFELRATVGEASRDERYAGSQMSFDELTGVPGPGRDAEQAFRDRSRDAQLAAYDVEGPDAVRCQEHLGRAAELFTEGPGPEGGRGDTGPRV